MAAFRARHLAQGVEQLRRHPHGTRAVFAHAAGVLRDERAEKSQCGD
jgi:hypothetical protein